MGVLSLLKGADEAAAGADEAAGAADEFVSSDEAAQSFFREAPDGVNSGGGYVSFDGDSYLQRVGADFTGRVAEQPARAADAATGNIATAGKWLGGGTAAGVGLWAGSEVYEDYAKMRSMESKEAAYSEYQRRAEEIRNNDNLSPDEKEEMLAQLYEAYQAAIENPDNPTRGTLAKVFNDLFGGMGMMDKVLVGIAFVVLVKLSQEMM